MLISTAYAMGAAGGQAGQAGGLAGFLPIIILFAIFYFLLIRPQQKKAKEHKAMIDNLKKGNRVVTSGGIFGTIVSMDDTTLGLEIAEKVKIKVARANIAALISDNEAATKPKENN
ncbi:MAG: preprotein translocase subunit YajC [Desulfobacter postgatei]|uniref:preprotein translocase subunit YajC n=1 Tax=Desulfobacter postgatei TaxID=2293 RepID=UPI0023F33490|nr:preprotein translocase subunit YajC [Desulfobacter postgatei]MDD4273124.1 preprotein translocase subunit YajC [Desulfobacter postgatei]